MSPYWLESQPPGEFTESWMVARSALLIVLSWLNIVPEIGAAAIVAAGGQTVTCEPLESQRQRTQAKTKGLHEGRDFARRHLATGSATSPSRQRDVQPPRPARDVDWPGWPR